jgi:hypothetical protein
MPDEPTRRKGNDASAYAPQPSRNDRPAIHRPDDEIPGRPQLRVRPVGAEAGRSSAGKARPAGPEPQPALKSGTLFVARPDGKRGAAQAPKAVVPPIGEHPHATYRSGPAGASDGGQQPGEVAAGTGSPGGTTERRVSTGFAIGLLVIAFALLGGIWIARLSGRVRQLESRVARMEGLRASPTPLAGLVR